MIDDITRKKFFIDNEILETYIPCDDNTLLRWDQKTYMKYRFPNGDEITLQFGPICRIDQIDMFYEHVDEVIVPKMKRIKLEKIKELINVHRTK